MYILAKLISQVIYSLIVLSRRENPKRLDILITSTQGVINHIESEKQNVRDNLGRKIKDWTIKFLVNEMRYYPQNVPGRLLADRKSDLSWTIYPYHEDIDYLPREGKFESIKRLGTLTGEVLQEVSHGYIEVEDEDWIKFGPKILESFKNSVEKLKVK